MRSSLRTHTCGALRRTDVGAVVTLCGWVNARRDQGGVAFVDLRDRHGLTQVTFRGDQNAPLLEAASHVRPEWCLRVTGKVTPRPAGAVNANLPTGEIEVEATALEVLSESPVPPFWPTDRTEANVDLRLEYRFIDLRRPKMTRMLVERAHILSTFRRHLEEQGYLEVETPMLTRSTPEGSRDFLVPSRLHPGSFYALPAVAPAVQAAADGLGLRPLLPDRALHPRRGQPRRPPARVQPGRRRGQLPRRGGRVRPDRAHRRRADPALPRARRAGAVPAHAVRRGDGPLRLRQARPAQPARDRRRLEGGRHVRLPRLRGGRRQGRRRQRDAAPRRRDR